MSSAQPPADSTPKDNGEPDQDDQGGSVVSPPAYPAYSTPPPEGLSTGEDG
jgi:hypothetical protein